MLVEFLFLLATRLVDRRDDPERDRLDPSTFFFVLLLDAPPSFPEGAPEAGVFLPLPFFSPIGSADGRLRLKRIVLLF